MTRPSLITSMRSVSPSCDTPPCSGPAQKKVSFILGVVLDLPSASGNLRKVSKTNSSRMEASPK